MPCPIIVSVDSFTRPNIRVHTQAIAAAVDRNPLVGQMLSRQQRLKRLDDELATEIKQIHNTGSKPVYACMTNCTYDGLCIDAARAEKLLGQTVDRIHFGAFWVEWAGRGLSK